MIAIAEHTGLICGYVFGPGGTRAIDWDGMDAALASQTNSVVWLHFNLADQRACHWLTELDQLPPAARRILLADDRHVRLTSTGRGITGIVGDMHHDLNAAKDEVGMLHFYFDDRLMISARRLPLRAADSLRHAVDEGLTVNRPIDLAIELFHFIAGTIDEFMDRLREELDEVEDPILAGHLTRRSDDLGRARRLTARIRRHLVPQKHALVALQSHLPNWVSKEEVDRLRHAVERMEVLSHELESMQERARLLNDELSNRLMEETNRNLFILSIVTVVFLPMTLISGIFGMNLGGMPGLQNDYGFWWGMLLIAVVGGMTMMIMRLMRLSGP